ncbi:hypothetical protein TWF102_008427 [Orbilia oligospora]|uniref:F-box domain-containing protein n=1 Tax=Orbilia oligospora TaxID=2813651 RepID=A0A7C8J6I6_ORBOL|nr:hypothetical protein TWF102_008427 [Orbilia oligospora]KAF3096345.1 hypothetical protein TWF103_009913 [Orbilia oligospora]
MPLRDLPREIHHEILSHLDEIVDQVAADLALPLWSNLFQTRALQETRYHFDRSRKPGFPSVHSMFQELANQISCVVKNGTVECYRFRFPKGKWWENPNLQDVWDISTCSFLDEPLVKSTADSADKGSWKIEISTISPLSWTYPQPFECSETTTVREFIDASTGSNINLEGYIEGEGLPLDTYQEVIIQGSTVYDGGEYSEYRSPPARDPEVTMVTTALGGGHMTTIHDPEGVPVNFIYGASPRPQPKRHPLEALQINDEISKPRKGAFQRFKPGPAAVHKVTHTNVIRAQLIPKPVVHRPLSMENAARVPGVACRVAS